MLLPSAALWDMDGTIVDTEPLWVAAEMQLVKEHGGTWSHEDAMACVGQSLEVSASILQRAGVTLEVDAIITRLINEVMAQLKGPGVVFRPGARELLAAFAEAGVPQALVTMSYRRMAELVVALLPEGTFRAVVTGDEVERGKPFPDAYLQATELLGVTPASSVAFEDSPTGVRAAVAAGVVTVGIPHMVPLDGIGAHHLADSLAEYSVDDIRAIHERFTS